MSVCKGSHEDLPVCMLFVITAVDVLSACFGNQISISHSKRAACASMCPADPHALDMQLAA